MAASLVDTQGYLTVKGNRIVGKRGKPVAVHGMSLFWSQWIGKYYTPEVVRWLRDDWGCTVVRAALAVEPDGYVANPQREREKVFRVVDAAIQAGIYVIIDWHDHHAERNQQAACTFFAEAARRYGKYPHVVFETYNEPLDKTDWGRTIRPYHEAVIAAIRPHAPRSLIVCGTRAWSQQVEEASKSPLADKNVAYALHFYAGTHKQWLRDNATRALQNGVALFVTEHGTTDATGDGPVDVEETRRWWDFCSANDLSWCAWSIADKNESSAALRPGASEKGGWAESELSVSGKLVRSELRRLRAGR